MSIKIKKSLVGKPAPVGVGRTSTEMAEWMVANGKCPEYVSGSDRWSRGRLCGRPIKDEERGLCGVHVGVLARRESASAKRKADRQRSEDNAARADRLVAALNKLLPEGYAEQHYMIDNSGLRFTGKVVLNATAAEAVLAALTKKG